MKKYLNDVVIIRLVLIVLLVLYHAFAIYNGAWVMPDGIHEVKTYWWIASFSYSFMLEAFVFISGLVFGFQVRNKYGGKVSAENGIVKKAKRLLIPSIVFSIIYVLCFGMSSDISWGGLVYNIIGGVGHMWFLPMLFWCFVGIYLIEKLKGPIKVALILSVIMSIFSLTDLPLRLSSSAYYFLFFYLGYLIDKENLSIRVKMTLRNTMIVWGIYLLVFVASKLIFSTSQIQEFSELSIYNKFIVAISQRILQIIYSLAGTVGIFMLSNIFLERKVFTISERMIKWSGYCMGIYIVQQFILMPFVHSHSVVDVLGTYWLPWVAFGVAMSGSVMIAYILRKTCFGRVLIG